MSSPPTTELIGALPNKISPPQSPGPGVAVADVKIIGFEEVPSALITPPCSTAT